ncbi:MAG TPA: hypothetical protein PLK80_13360 [bacterium]|nr:MAG: hypothetical protein BWY28_02084 [bacterium ADurb.Bin236]HOY63452.1 hypothetical protein [bacterium]HPI77713.1 hypothetical protein [bacterium]HPN95146.1 hypothetical protein [bacterium]
MKKKNLETETGRISELINTGELAGIERELGDCVRELEQMKKTLEKNGGSRQPENPSVSSE